MDSNVRRACLTILGSLVPISNHLTDIKISIEETNIDWISGFNERDFAFSDVSMMTLFEELIAHHYRI